MQKLCKLLCLLLVCCMLPLGTACIGQADRGTGYTFTDSAGFTVTLSTRPSRVAVMFSSLAELWLSAGGEVTMTVGESVERGLVPSDVTVLAEGAGKSPNAEAIIAAAPELVLLSADLADHVSCAGILRAAGIPTALFHVETFDDYLTVLKVCTDINGRPDLYDSVGLTQKERIDALIAAKPLAGKRILFARASSSSVKAKSSADHFAAEMLTQLGAVNIADELAVLSGDLSIEAILQEDPDYLVFSLMGNEQAARDNLAALLADGAWKTLTAVQNDCWGCLPKALFHYKPNAAWADAYAYLAALIP